MRAKGESKMLRRHDKKNPRRQSVVAAKYDLVGSGWLARELEADCM